MSEGPREVRAKQAAGRGGQWFLVIVGAVWLLALLSFGFVGIVDPYELRSPHPSYRLAEHAYPEDVVPRLFPLAGDGGADVVIIGASDARGYTPAMIGAAFPEARRPFNLSYGCATADDYRQVLPRLESSKTLKRVIFSLDSTLIWPCAAHVTPLDPRYYRLSWNEPVPEFGAESIDLALRALLTNVVDLPAWRPASPDRVHNITDLPPLTQSPAALETAAQSLDVSRRELANAGDVSCDAIPSLRTLVVPFVRRLSRRGVAVDLLSPTVSLAYYADPHTGHSAGESFAYLMALRRCALVMTAGLPGVRFHSFDTDTSITGQISIYMDIAHICLPNEYLSILRHIADGDHVLTPAGWPAAEAQLKRDIAGFHPDAPLAGSAVPHCEAPRSA